MTNGLRLFAVLGLTITAGIALLIAFPVGSPSPEEAGRAVDQIPAVQPGLPPAEVETPNTAKSLDLQPPPDSSTSAAKPPLPPIAELESHVASAPDQEMIRPELPEQAQTLPEDPPATMPSAVAPSSLSVAEPGIPGSSITASTPPEAVRSAEPLLSVPTSSTETHASDTAALSKVETPAEPAAVSRRVEQRAAPLQKAPIPISPPQLAPRSLARPHKGSTVAEERAKRSRPTWAGIRRGRERNASSHPTRPSAAVVQRNRSVKTMGSLPARPRSHLSLRAPLQAAPQKTGPFVLPEGLRPKEP